MRFTLKLFLWGVIVASVFGTAAVVFAQIPCISDCPIDSGEFNHWAWNDVIGWIDFQYKEYDNVRVNNDDLSGYASSSVGFIALNCNTIPGPTNGSTASNCDISYKVANDGAGNLSGWAWNDNIGWISFSCVNQNTCGTGSGQADYGVTIDNIGFFYGWAWNDVVGWISFNCDNPGTNGCSDLGVNYKVKTTWSFQLPASATLTSSVFDTCPTTSNCGAGVNTIMWKGSDNGGRVDLTLETGDTATVNVLWKSQDFLNSGKDAPQKVTNAQMQNKRYFRYKVTLMRDVTGRQSPAVGDIIVNWSP